MRELKDGDFSKFLPSGQLRMHGIFPPLQSDQSIKLRSMPSIARFPCMPVTTVRGDSRLPDL